MLILRAIFLELLVCLHFLGAAFIFRRLFPKESIWFSFLVPTLVFVTSLNFLEHFFALPILGWLLPFTVGSISYAIIKIGPREFKKLRFPIILFVPIFTFIFLLKCFSPDIPNFTEGIFNLSRILCYCLTEVLPPQDCWLPPYEYGGYYTFQHYGAAVLKRLFAVDLGTAYNVSFVFLLSWLCLMGAGVAHSLTRKRWIAVSMVIMLLSGSTGSVIFLIFFSQHGADYSVSTAINDFWNDQDRNPFCWFSRQDLFHPGLKLLPPAYTLYYSEYHANLGGAFITIVSLLAASELFKKRRSNWSWILLVALPMLVIITSAWFFFIVAFLCGGSLIIALSAGRRPRDLKFTCIGAAVALVFLWPSFYSISGNPNPPAFHWTNAEDHTPLWMFLVQWWPIWLPWLCLCCVWHRLDLMSRWMHAAIPILYLGVEYCTFGDHGLTLEKMWGGVYGAGLVTLPPMLFRRKNIIFRAISVVMIISFAICLAAWLQIRSQEVDPSIFFHLQGDTIVQHDHPSSRLLEVLKSLHGQIILPGKSYWDYNPAPAVITFSENKCYVAYYAQEEQAGNGKEAKYRNDQTNLFYAGKMTAPLSFLHVNHIAAVLIWQEDEISDALLQQFQQQIGSEYYYIDCKMDGAHNAGVFLRGYPPATATLLPPPANLKPSSVQPQ